MIEQDLQTYLTAILANGVLVYPFIVPQGAAIPAVTYQTIGDPTTIDSTGPTDLIVGRFQFTTVAESYAEAKSLAKEIKTALDGYSDTMGNTEISLAMKDGHNEDHEESTNRFTVSQDFIIHFKE